MAQAPILHTSCGGGCLLSLFSSCFPKAKPSKDPKQPVKSDDRQGLLAGAADAKPDGPDEEPDHLDLRRLFSRNDISAIPENAEVNKGADTNQKDAASLMTQGLGEPTAKPPPSPLPRRPSGDLERLFSRGAVRNQSTTLNRLFSRGAMGRSGSGLGGSWSQRSQRASTTDSQTDDLGDEKVEVLNDVNQSPLLFGRTFTVNSSTPVQPRTSRIEDITALDDDSRGVLDAKSTLVHQSSSSGSVGRVASRRKLPELAEAIKRLQQVSDHLVVATMKADTRDHEDHTFSGIYFNVEARTLLPAEFIEIQSISIRGDLGPVSIYSTDGTYEDKQGDPSKWIRHFGPLELSPSRETLYEIILEVPIRLAPGSSRGVYVHSELPGDSAIVYDEQRNFDCTYEDNIIRIRPGMAHTSNVPFLAQAPWGGTSYRPRREFVGSMRYGGKLLMWTPEVHHHFPPSFRRSVFTLLCCRSVLRKSFQQGQGLEFLPQEIFFYIINMLPWDWFPDATAGEEESFLENEVRQPFQYGGHVGRIAHLRHLFDSAREQTSQPVDGSPSVESRTLVLEDNVDERVLLDGPATQAINHSEIGVSTKPAQVEGASDDVTQPLHSNEKE